MHCLHWKVPQSRPIYSLYHQEAVHTTWQSTAPDGVPPPYGKTKFDLKVNFFKVSFAFFCASIAWQASASQDFLSFGTTFVYKQYKVFLFLS